MASKPKKRAPAPAPAEPARTAPTWQVIPFLERHAILLAIALVALATFRIVATYTVFNHTYDEPAHLACGTEWLDKGVYTWEPQHPPLSRVLVSLGPFLIGARSQNTPRTDEFSMTYEGLAILYQGNHYDLTVALARAGNLPFFWIGCWVVYLWAARYWGKAAAVLSVFVFTFFPPILAHAGLATTDMACTASIAACFLAAVIWVEEPSWKHGAIFGLAGAFAICSKFSCLVFFPAAAVAALVWFLAAERPAWSSIHGRVLQLLPSLGLAILVACISIWAVYRFSFGHPLGMSFSMPAPELVSGIKQVMDHEKNGHPSYLLGKISSDGFWNFYLVDIAVKTPLAILLLLGFGAVLAVRRVSQFRRAWLPLAYALGILVVALFSHINIGIRHVLPMYAAFSLLAALALLRLLELGPANLWARAGLVVLTGWFAVSSILAHPDYLPYFNEFAGSHPENIVVDSDLDWGQDIKRLATRLRQLHATQVAFLPFLLADLERQGLPPITADINALRPMPGWNAVSLTVLKQRRFGLRGHPELTPWPELAPPDERVGKSIWLYYMPPN